MQQSFEQRPVVAPAVVGLLLIALGAIILIARAAGLDILTAVGGWGWPLFIIVPGLVLLVASVVPVPPAGLGFAIAGAIFTTIGSLLAYQSRTGDWESWAYAWALIPTAAGVALLAYGLYARRPSMVRGGMWLAGTGVVLLAIGAWFFGGIFTGELRPAATDWWPIAIVAVGGLLVLRALLVGRPLDDAPDHGVRSQASAPGREPRTPEAQQSDRPIAGGDASDPR